MIKHCIVFFFLALSEAFCATVALNNGVSPDGKYEILLSIGEDSRLSYEVIQKGVSSPILRIASAYQAALDNEEATSSWAVEMSKSAEVYWSDNSSLVAIDEENHRFLGTVHIVAINGPRATELLLPSVKELTPNISWERYRIRVDQAGWSGSRVIALLVAGKAKSADRVDTFTSRQFKVEVEVDDKVKVKSRTPLG